MKMKSFAMLVVSGVLFSSGAYIAPAMADDDSSGQSMMLAESDMPNINTNVAANDATTDGAAANPSDAGGPDTATGDDDY